MPTLQGVIKDIFPDEYYGNFRKRVFWLAEVNAKYPNTWAIECWHDDACNELSSYRPGDAVKVTFEVKGKLWSKGGKEGVINTLRMTVIDRLQPKDVTNVAQAEKVQQEIIKGGPGETSAPYDDLPF